jgi:hypothetical protein
MEEIFTNYCFFGGKEDYTHNIDELFLNLSRTSFKEWEIGTELIVYVSSLLQKFSKRHHVDKNMRIF